MAFWLACAGALGSGTVGGIFFAFSNFVMAALGRLPPAQGAAAMNAINVTVLNPLFFVVFFGTGFLGLALLFVSIMLWPEPGARWLLAAALTYLVGCIGVTMVFNVPLNNALGAAPNDGELWTRYRRVWTAWNTVRTLACIAASGLFVAALISLT
ncbi:MAG: DUF1772 domain-containing protein [Enhydrobacter sp.]|nr:MAG: DUF1772 domain-containing protein [Enhydrobacter sp.]